MASKMVLSQNDMMMCTEFVDVLIFPVQLCHIVTN